MLKPGGSLVIEAHYLVDLLEQGAFDTVYHEHVSYWALGSMKYLFEQHGLEVVNAERLPIHHGQLRATIRRAGEASRPRRGAVLAAERAMGVDKFETYQRFAQNVEKSGPICSRRSVGCAPTRSGSWHMGPRPRATHSSSSCS